jgi:enterochelin esterase-like enzyme
MRRASLADLDGRKMPRALLTSLVLLLTTVFLAEAEKRDTQQLISLAVKASPQLQEAIEETFPAKDLDAGAASSGHLHDFFFAARAATRPSLFIDDQPGPAMTALAGAQLWYAAAQIEKLGDLHSFYYEVGGKKFGGSNDLPAFTELSYPMRGVPQGKLSDKMIFTSKIYDGMRSEYWIYMPAGYDPRTPAALMVFQDGGAYIKRDDSNHALNVIDNLIAQKKVPYMICVFVNPGKISGPPGSPTYEFVKAYSEKWHRTLDDSMRSTLYDTVSDRYPRFLLDELLPEVMKKYNIRADAYSHAITGLSSGGICSFNAAWQMPGQFSRVISWIGSFTSIQWKETPGVTDGGQDYPEKILRESHRNLRVWLQDGSNDLEWNQYGSWAPANIRMANALKLQEYDFHFSFGHGSHNTGHGDAQFPREMIWLWRDYDSSKTSQLFEIEPEEKAQPQFRVTVTNRSAE